MNYFTNLKISQKLISTFILVSLFVGLVGFVGISNMSKLNSNASDIYNHNLASINKLSALRENQTIINGNLLLLIYDKDRNKIVDVENEIGKLKEQNAALMAQYKNATTNDEDRKLSEEVDTLMTNYRIAREDIIKHVNDNQYDEALADLPQLSETSKTMFDSTDKLINLNIQWADEANMNNNLVYKSSLVTIIIIIIICLFVAISLGLIISLSMSKQIKQLLAFAKALEKGDLTQKIHINSKDEIGILANALINAREI